MTEIPDKKEEAKWHWMDYVIGFTQVWIGALFLFLGIYNSTPANSHFYLEATVDFFISAINFNIGLGTLNWANKERTKKTSK